MDQGKDEWNQDRFNPKQVILVNQIQQLWLTFIPNSSIIVIVVSGKASSILNQLSKATQKGNTMSQDKLFTVAGTATNPNGTTKARFANDLVARIKILNKAGCTNINLVELPRAMTKLEALQYLTEQGVTGDAGYAVANKLAEKTKIAKKGEVKVKAVKTSAKSAEKVTA